MPDERFLEILVAKSVKNIFGDNFCVAAQQFTLPSGRVDLFLEERSGCKHIVELKKDVAKVEAVEQVYRYVEDFRRFYSGNVQGWVLANSIDKKATAEAERLGIKTVAIPESDYPKLIKISGISEKDLLGVRVQDGVLKGGGLQKFHKNSVDLSHALSILPSAACSLIDRIQSLSDFSFTAGKLQVVVSYRGVKIGGVNRLHYYISSNVIIDAADNHVLEVNGFQRITKTQAKSSHVHVYWKSNLSNITGADFVFRHFAHAIETRVFS